MKKEVYNKHKQNCYSNIDVMKQSVAGTLNVLYIFLCLLQCLCVCLLQCLWEVSDLQEAAMKAAVVTGGIAGYSWS